MRGVASPGGLSILLLILTCSWISVGAARVAHSRSLSIHSTKEKLALIVAPIGDVSQHLTWLDQQGAAAPRNWDLFALYYGSTPDSFSCHECVGIQYGQGAKWRLVSGFLNSTAWRHDLSHRYKMVMIPDDDLHMPLSMLNRFFQTFDSFGLVLGQPSVCPGSQALSWEWFVGQNENTSMRFTNFVELMAPTFETSFLNTTVRSTLTEAYTGWALDFIWPFLLHFPLDKVAIVDLVCVGHSGVDVEGRQRVYNAEMPRNADGEKDFFMAKYGYTQEALNPYNLTFWVPTVLAVLPLEAEPPPAIQPVVLSSWGLAEESRFGATVFNNPLWYLVVLVLLGTSVHLATTRQNQKKGERRKRRDNSAI